MHEPETQHGPVVAADGERPALVTLDAALRDQERDLQLVDAAGERIELVDTARRLLREVVHALADDRPVAVVVLPREVTGAEAAAMLSLTAGDVARLVATGELPMPGHGSPERFRVDEVLAYKGRRDVERRAALDELARMSREIEPLLR